MNPHDPKQKRQDILHKFKTAYAYLHLYPSPIPPRLTHQAAKTPVLSPRQSVNKYRFKVGEQTHQIITRSRHHHKSRVKPDTPTRPSMALQNSDRPEHVRFAVLALLDRLKRLRAQVPHVDLPILRPAQYVLRVRCETHFLAAQAPTWWCAERLGRVEAFVPLQLCHELCPERVKDVVRMSSRAHQQIRPVARKFHARDGKWPWWERNFG